MREEKAKIYSDRIQHTSKKKGQNFHIRLLTFRCSECHKLMLSIFIPFRPAIKAKRDKKPNWKKNVFDNKIRNQNKKKITKFLCSVDVS